MLSACFLGHVHQLPLAPHVSDGLPLGLGSCNIIYNTITCIIIYSTVNIVNDSKCNKMQ